MDTANARKAWRGTAWNFSSIEDMEHPEISKTQILK
jgi:hypothetical protein